MTPARAAFVDRYDAIAAPWSEFARDAIAGLRRIPKALPCKYFYDKAGSRLFEEICTLAEYYPTRTEIGLLRTHAREIADLMGPDATLVEFGAGSLQKIDIVLDALDHPRAYLPVDISGDYLNGRAGLLADRYPALSIRPIVADFTQPLDIAGYGGRLAGFFPGSTIGNFERGEARAFLRRMAKLCAGLLIGVDLVKDPAILHAAYNDAAGVTEAFNKNILIRANRELDAGFDPDAFAHYAFYDPQAQRVEMHLVSLSRQEIHVAGENFTIAEGETIHTENSHKYTVDGFRELAAQAGFKIRAVWCDERRHFGLFWLEA